MGSLADQTDPRPKTKGMQFALNPGVNYQISPSIALGISGHIGWMGESTAYTVVNTTEASTSTIFLQRGLSNPELKNSIGYKREYDGDRYGGNIQFVWNKNSAIRNLLDIGLLTLSEKANDGDTDFDYKGGDYKATGITILDRFSLHKGEIIHNFTLTAMSKKVDGTWYIQTQSTDTDGNTIWTVRDKSISHKDSRTQAKAKYRMDLMRGDVPHLTWSVATSYTNSEIKQYPELYTQKYSLMTIYGDITKHIHAGNGLFSFSVNGEYTSNLSSEFNVAGSKLASSYLEPAFQAISGSAFAAGINISYKKPMHLSGYPFIMGMYADASLRKHNDQFEIYKNTDRKTIHIGLSFVF